MIYVRCMWAELRKGQEAGFLVREFEKCEELTDRALIVTVQ